MSIFSIMLARNERDIVEHTVRRALEWSDYIFVCDHSSTDGTWEVMQSLASDRVLLAKRAEGPFHEGLRGEVFTAFRHLARPGDWWCRLDADEVYVDDPREFLARVPRRHAAVWGIAIEYYLTPEDVERIDFSRPIEAVLADLRHYRAENSELRFFRHRRRLEWGPLASWPSHVGVTHPRRIRYRHYKYRSPAQIAARLDTRRQALAAGLVSWAHWNDTEWRAKLAPGHTCRVDRGDGRFEVDEAKLPDHMGPRHKRLAKHLLHGLGILP